MEDLYKLIHEEVAREARLAAAKWHGLMDADDIEQELWLYIMESPSVQAYLRTANGAQIKTALSLKANSICSQERLEYDHFTGNWVYNTTEVRVLLENKAQFADNSYDEAIDLDLAMADLAEEYPDQHDVISEAFFQGVDYSDTNARRRKSRALERLTTIMNRKRSQRETDRHEGLGTKPKITDNNQEDY